MTAIKPITRYEVDECYFCVHLQVSDLQGSVQELEEALDKESAAHNEAQTTLEEAYRHRNSLEAR